MTLTKAYVLWFDGFQGVAVDYLDNQYDFSTDNVPPNIVPYIEKNTEVLLEDDRGFLFVTLPAESFDRWEDKERDLLNQDTAVYYLGDE